MTARIYWETEMYYEDGIGQREGKIWLDKYSAKWDPEEGEYYSLGSDLFIPELYKKFNILDIRGEGKKLSDLTSAISN